MAVVDIVPVPGRLQGSRTGNDTEVTSDAELTIEAISVRWFLIHHLHGRSRRLLAVSPAIAVRSYESGLSKDSDGGEEDNRCSERRLMCAELRGATSKPTERSLLTS